MYPGTKKRKNAVVGQSVVSTEQTNDNAKPQQQEQKRPKRSRDEIDNVSDTKNAIDRINDDAATTTTNNNNNSNNITYLEEQKTIHGITLQAWRQRRDQILTQREAAIVTKRELLDQRDKILIRQKNLEETRMKHISLQSNLIESLNKSRERLRRLTILLQEEEQEQEVSANDENDDDDVIRSKQKLQLSESDCTTSREELEDVDNNDGVVDDHQIQQGRQEQNISTKQQELENSSPSFSQHYHHHLPLAYNPYRINNSNKQLIRYHSFLGEEGKKTFSHPRRRSLLGFLPYLDATQVGEYLTLMLREAKTFDDEINNNQDLEKSLRRKLLENTCLDILLLTSSTTTSHIEEKSKLDTTNNNVVIDLTEDNSVNDDNKGDDDDNIVDSKLYSINPNISLCPYEMDGVCADDLCPYQHTSKDTKVMARERLPLPSLSSFLSATPIGTEKKPKNGKTQQKTSTIVATVKTNTETAITTLEATTEKNNEYEGLLGGTEEREDQDENVFGREEDLMMLPPSNSPGDSDEENENDSDDELDRGNDSDDEAQEGSLPLSAPSSMNQDTDLKTRNCDKGAFWWGGKLPSSRKPSLPTDETDTPCKKVELSITDILKETFGIVIHTMKRSETTTTTTDRLEVKGMLLLNVDASDKILNWLETLGRLVDASRLAMHGGLDCVALTVSRMYKGDGFLKDLTFDGDSDHLHSLIAFFKLMESQAEVSWFHERESQLSCFQTAFATQIGMSILSWSLGTKWKTLHLADEGGNRTEEKTTSTQSVSLEAICKICWDIMRRPPIKNAYRMRSFDGEELKRLLLKDASKDNPAANSIDQLKNLKHLILWAQKQFAIPPYDKLHLSDQLLEERLKETWLICRKFLRDYQESSSIEQFDFELQCLKVVIVMGYAIFGSLTSFASAAADGARKKDRKWILISSHSGSNLAAWTILDGSIVRILKELRKHTADIPLLDLALAPLYSCSVASASFLRNYSAAQQRLVDCLKRTTFSDMLSYSELLWSQLVQLRMSLPNESTSSVSVASNLLTGKKPSKRDDDFSWEQSSVVKEETRLLVSKLESTGINLRHVVLWGDWMLSLMIQNNDDADNQNSSTKLLLLLQADTPNKSDDSTSIHMKKDLQRLQNLSINAGRTYPPITPLPQLPLFLLHAGHFLTDLNLNMCGLNHLPRSFGLYFPNLKRMNLSHNELTELPESFQNMTRRMKFLEEFYTDHNRLESLPSNIFSNTTGTTSSSSGSGLSSLQQTSSPLRILDLSYNRLTSIPSLVATTLTHLEVLELNNNLLIDLTMMDLSRLALKLPTLREMTHENQKDVKE
jgi:hypothetical protein